MAEAAQHRTIISFSEAETRFDKVLKGTQSASIINNYDNNDNDNNNSINTISALWLLVRTLAINRTLIRQIHQQEQ